MSIPSTLTAEAPSRSARDETRTKSLHAGQGHAEGGWGWASLRLLRAGRRGQNLTARPGALAMNLLLGHSSRECDLDHAETPHPRMQSRARGRKSEPPSAGVA